MSDITPETSVNIVCAEHGFCLSQHMPQSTQRSVSTDALPEQR